MQIKLKLLNNCQKITQCFCAPTFFLSDLRLWWNGGWAHQQILEILLENKNRRYRLISTHTCIKHTRRFSSSLTMFSLVTMNFSTLCCLILNILEPLFVSRESSSSITSLGVLILVPKSNSEASGSDSSSERKEEEEEDKLKRLNME